MIKNTASQRIGAQMVSATDGSAFTGSVTVSVTGDAGTQATGSVGSGACAHEGNGYHTYAPAQAETNYDLIAFTFTGTGAIPQTVQVFTVTGPLATASALAVVDGIVDDILVDTGTTLQAELDGIQADTEDIQARLPAALVSGRIDASVGAAAANTLTASALASDAVTEIQSGLATAAELAKVPKSDGTSTWNATALASLQSEATDALNAYDPPTKTELDSAVSPLATAANLATVAGYLDTEIAAILADTNELQSDWVNGGRLDLILDARASQASVSALNNLSAAQVNAEVVDALATDVIADSIPADGSRPTIAQALYLLTQFMLERSVSGTTMTVRKPDGSTTLLTLTLNDGTSPTSITRAS